MYDPEPVKIAFVSGNREKLPDAVVPLGLLYVMASTPARHERILIDLCFEREPEKALAERIAAFAPELVALGMRNIQSNDYSGVADTLGYYDRLLAAVRGATRAPIAVGGSGFSVMPRELMERLRPDFGLSGEAERGFPQLVDALAAGGGFEAIASLHWFDGGALRSNAPGPFLDLDALPVPDRGLVDARYYDRYGIESVQTKRGCPLRCEYCTYPIIEGRVGRAHLVDDRRRRTRAAGRCRGPVTRTRSASTPSSPSSRARPVAPAWRSAPTPAATRCSRG